MTRMKNVFISYSRDDIDYVQNNVVGEIESINGVNCWLDVHDIEAGVESFPNVIKQGLKECFIFLIMLSESSMKKDWPLKELKDAEALKAEDPSRKIVLVKIDSSELTDKFEEYKEMDIIDWNVTYQHRKLLNNIDQWNQCKSESIMAEGIILENSTNKTVIEKAFGLFTLAANMGLAEAQSKVAYYYLTGKSDIVEKNLGEALIWGGKAYKQGYPGAASLMASICKEMGDNAGYIEFHNNAAKNGWAFSQFKIGEAYYKGCMKCDVLSAIYWLKQAADQEQPDATELIGDILKDQFKAQEEAAKRYYDKALKLFEEDNNSNDEKKKEHAQKEIEKIKRKLSCKEKTYKQRK